MIRLIMRLYERLVLPGGGYRGSHLKAQAPTLRPRNSRRRNHGIHFASDERGHAPGSIRQRIGATREHANCGRGHNEQALKRGRLSQNVRTASVVCTERRYRRALPRWSASFRSPWRVPAGSFQFAVFLCERAAQDRGSPNTTVRA
jgi:hypothetical protein